ncbi:MAG: ribosome-associated translation inhibitor RaiA [Candidatus Paceibacterota bacterium]|jgi:putative sigma-54 modulation protein
MKLNINAIEMQLTPAIQLYVEKKFGLLKKLLVKQEKLDTVLVKVEIGKTTKHHHSGLLFKAEAHVKVGKDSYNASATTDDLYASIDAMKDELEREIVSKKDRAQTLRTRGARKIKKILKGLKKA